MFTAVVGAFHQRIWVDSMGEQQVATVMQERLACKWQQQQEYTTFAAVQDILC
jgi:hypothetical protein